mmetsp:Transcript_4968/g.6744  ORF Transcript_4968/g.6744 Transcript_4968/m.6744 type:complete len:146 (-) Transcript_4968:1291-1728(-)
MIMSSMKLGIQFAAVGSRILYRCRRNNFRYLSVNGWNGDDPRMSATNVNVSSWRKDELHAIQEKFGTNGTNGPNGDGGIEVVKSDEELQSHWKDMESRVTRRRRPLTVAEAAEKGKPIGRRNVRQTDEEAWLEAGLYSRNDNSDK